MDALGLVVNDDPGLTAQEMRDRFAKDAERLGSSSPSPGLSLIAVDYLQLSTAELPGGQPSGREEEMREIVRGLKSLARDLDFPG